MAVLPSERIAEMLFSAWPDASPRSASFGSLQAVCAAVDADSSLDPVSLRLEITRAMSFVHGTPTRSDAIHRAIATARAVASLPVVRPMF